ncbi:beta-hexosaminidase subunit beta-like [Periplaneta americana]|uniref:beta-hexosaminidase subunit beta-like n=1 Tax=Periplaneta americana TaxID=6978 RepID=UPI0037E9AA46
MLRLLTVCLLVLAAACNGTRYYNRHTKVSPGPWVTATSGQPWPKPQQIVNYDGYVVVRPSIFTFQVTKENCDLLQEAIKRYYNVIIQTRDINMRTRSHREPISKGWKKDPQFRAYLDSLEIQLMAPCEDLPYLHMDEHYELRINTPDLPGAALLTSQTVWGVLRGMETFSQLLSIDDSGAALKVNSSAIMDFPRYSHRGLLLDTARHFYPLPAILQTLDAMEINKMNVFHWHIVDDNSFPYESAVFPQLSEKGAYNHRTHVYTREDIRTVIEHARLRGIRVIPEFDSPGHTESWGLGQPDLLTPCYSGSTPDGTFGPVDPILETSYEFFNKFLAEAVELFPEKYIHLGGDEVSFDCWASNPDILQFMESRNITGNFGKLEEIYIQRLLDMTANLSANSLVWQEVLDNGVILPEGTVVHVWTGDMEEELEKVTAEGHPALVSACWYLDHLASGGDWHKFYTCDPNSFNGTEEQKSLVIGGEACMWSEFADASNLSPRVWPRAAAAAERLWSSVALDFNEADPRMEEHVCRLNSRGIPAQPANGPGYCPYTAYYH